MTGRAPELADQLMLLAALGLGHPVVLWDAQATGIAMLETALERLRPGGPWPSLEQACRRHVEAFRRRLDPQGGKLEFDRARDRARDEAHVVALQRAGAVLRRMETEAPA